MAKLSHIDVQGYQDLRSLALIMAPGILYLSKLSQIWFFSVTVWARPVHLYYYSVNSSTKSAPLEE